MPFGARGTVKGEKTMKTKLRNLIISFLLTLAMLLGVLATMPMAALAASSGTPTPQETPAETIYVGGVALSKGQYVENGETTAVTGEPDWEKSGFAFYASSGTFHLSDYEYEGTGYTHDTSEKSVIYSEGKLEIILHGKNSIKNNTADTDIWAANGIRTKGNLIIDGPGSITINAPYAIYGNNLVKFEYGRTVIPSATVAIDARGNFIVNGGVLELHSTQPIYAGASFISGGSFFATAEQGVFQTAPTISVNTEDEYYLNICTDVEGTNQVAYIPENITQYKYFAVLPPTLTEIDSISVSGVVLPALGGKVGDASYAAATCGTGYFVFDMYVDKLVGETWVALEDTASIVAGVKYRVVLGIDTEEGYTISADIAGANVLINGQQATKHEIFAYPDYNTIDICYEFSYTATETPITSIAVSNLVLPTAGQTAADWDFNPGMLAFGGNYDFDDCGMQKYTGTEWVPMGAGDTTILTNVKYRFFIELSADEGYFFSPELTSDDVTIGDYDAVLLAVNVSGELAVVAAEFYYEAPPATPITSISVSGADLPEVGETADDMEFTPTSLTYGGAYQMIGTSIEKYTGTNWVFYSGSDDVIEAGVRYRLIITLMPTGTNAFAELLTSDDVTFNGKDAEFLGFVNAGTAKYAQIALEFSYEAPATDYGITIAKKNGTETVGVLITEENCTDVLGDGTVSFDPATNTLTLNGYKYEGEGAEDDDIGYYGLMADLPVEGLTIVLVGENSIKTSASNSVGMVFFGNSDLTIKGDGSLTINTGMQGIVMVENSGSMKINGGNIDITTTAVAVSIKDFVMTGGNLKITTNMFGFATLSADGAFCINGGSVEISTAYAGYAFIYVDIERETYNPIKPDLSGYVGAYKMTAGVNADGSDATDFNEVYLSSYKYVKVEPAHVHDHGSEWKTDAENHWNECACGDKANVAAHADENNDQKCDACGYEMPANIADPDITPEPDNSDTTPKEEDSDTTSEEEDSDTTSEGDDSDSTSDEPSESKKGLSTGAIIGIVIGSVAVAGVGGFALVWFAIKKKSFADLIAVFKKK